MIVHCAVGYTGNNNNIIIMGLKYLIPVKRVVGVCVVGRNDVHASPPPRWLLSSAHVTLAELLHTKDAGWWSWKPRLS